MSKEVFSLLTRMIQRQRSKPMLDIIADEIREDRAEGVEYTKDKAEMEKLRMLFIEQWKTVAQEQ